MTTDIAIPQMTHIVAGTGPYSVLWPYEGDDISVAVVTDTDVVTLTIDTGWTISPVAGPAGAVTLTEAAALEHAGRLLVITRGTVLEQGWQGLSGREIGLMNNMDRMMRGLQDVRTVAQSALRLPSGVAAPVVLEPGCLPVWTGEGFENGPKAADVAAGVPAALAAADTAQTAAGVAIMAAGEAAASAARIDLGALDDAVAATAEDRTAVGAALSAALYDWPKVDTFADLASVTPSMLAVGGVIRVIETGEVYRRVVSGGDLDYSGTGGVRLISLANATQIAYIDFTAKPNGAPPSLLDTGQVVDFVFDTTGRQPVMASSRLTAGTPPVSGGLATYYQAQLTDPVQRVGMEWTQPAGPDNGFGATVLIAWAAIYNGTGVVPKTWCHLTFKPGTGATGTAEWFVGDGAGNLISIKQQQFVNPAADGVTRWRAEAVLDVLAGKGYARLPDGSIMTLTNSEIAAFCTLISITPFSFSDIANCPVICCEHFAASNDNTAKFGGFTALWAETQASITKPWEFKGATLLDELKTANGLKESIPPLSTAITYGPSTALSVATTTSTANVDAVNAVIACVAGPTGKIFYDISANYDFSNTETVYWRLIISRGINATPLRAAVIGISGDKKQAHLMEAVSGLMPGVSYTATLQHSAINGARATLVAGGAGGTMRPPLTMMATPA